MNIQEALECLRNGKMAADGSQLHSFMHRLAEEAMQITAELNSGYHEAEKIRRLFSKLIGKPTRYFLNVPTLLFGMWKEHIYRRKCLYQLLLPFSRSRRYLYR